MKKSDMNTKLLDMAMWHGVLAEFDSVVQTLYVPCPRAEKIKDYSDDIISKCLDLIQHERSIAQKPVHESDFVLDPMYSKAEHYRVGRQHGIDICKKVISEYFGDKND